MSSDLAYKAEKIGKRDMEFGYYIKQFAYQRKHAKRIARNIKRGAKQNVAKDIRDALG